jgi:hypothetical protein
MAECYSIYLEVKTVTQICGETTRTLLNGVQIYKDTKSFLELVTSRIPKFSFNQPAY